MSERLGPNESLSLDLAEGPWVLQAMIAQWAEEDAGAASENRPQAGVQPIPAQVPIASVESVFFD